MVHIQLKSIKKIKLLGRKEFLTPKARQKAQVLPLTMTCNCTPPNIKQIIQNHWPILKTNKTLQKTFSIEPVIAFRKKKKKKKSLKQLIGGNTIQNDKNIKKSNSKYEGKCASCKSTIRSLVCFQVSIAMWTNQLLYDLKIPHEKAELNEGNMEKYIYEQRYIYIYIKIILLQWKKIKLLFTT